MSRERLRQFMDPDREIDPEVENIVLIRLYRKILFELGIDAATLESQLNRWINDPRHPLALRSAKTRVQERGNYIKRIVNKETMTFRTFMDLLSMLYPRYVRFQVHLGWVKDSSGAIEETVHMIQLDNKYYDKDGSEIYRAYAQCEHMTLDSEYETSDPNEAFYDDDPQQPDLDDEHDPDDEDTESDDDD